MELEYDVKPCPFCQTQMILKKVSTIGTTGRRHWYYFLYCSQCGYGPIHAFASPAEAIMNWNHAALSSKVSNNDQHYPGMF